MPKPPTTTDQQHEAAGSDTPEDGIGSRIRAAREARGLSQTAVSNRTKMGDPKGQGISRTVLVGYEAGHSKPGAREIRILCETLSVTPNWLLYGSETPHEASHPAMETMRNTKELASAIRLALAICVLRPHERSAFSSLVLSMAGRELGDLRLAGLLAMAGMLAEPAIRELTQHLSDEMSEDSPIEQTIDAIVKKYSDGLQTNWGTKLIIDPDDPDIVSGQWLYPDPQK